MLALHRKKDESVVLFNRATMELIGFFVAGSRGSHSFHLPRSIGVVRLELTQWAGMPADELRKIPEGTLVERRLKTCDESDVR